MSSPDKETTKSKKKMGRPTRYSKALSEEIIGRMKTGEPLNQICRDPKMPKKTTIYRWIAKDIEDFSNRYKKAFEFRASLMAYELLEIADDGSNDYMESLDQDGEVMGYRQNGEAVNRSRLRVDTRKWLLSRMLPKEFGDKPDKSPEQSNQSITVQIVRDDTNTSK